MKVIEIKYLPLPVRTTTLTVVMQIHTQGEGFSRSSCITDCQIKDICCSLNHALIERAKEFMGKYADMEEYEWDGIKISEATAIV